MDDRAVLQVTATLLGTGFLLVGLGAAGVASGLALVVAGAAATAGLYALVERLPPGRLGPVDSYLDRTVPVAITTLATVIAAVWAGASPGELQTLGGVVGLLGMANYFLRPVYHLLADVVAWATGNGR